MKGCCKGNVFGKGRMLHPPSPTVTHRHPPSPTTSVGDVTYVGPLGYCQSASHFPGSLVGHVVEQRWGKGVAQWLRPGTLPMATGNPPAFLYSGHFDGNSPS